MLQDLSLSSVSFCDPAVQTSETRLAHADIITPRSMNDIPQSVSRGLRHATYPVEGIHRQRIALIATMMHVASSSQTYPELARSI